MEATTNKQFPQIELVIGKEFAGKIIPLINKAIKSINIIVYDWRWYPDEIAEKVQLFNNAIIRARQKGIIVKVVVHKRLIHEILRRQNILVKKIESSKTIHVKLMIIDNEITILGSHNYTKNAFNFNYEVSAIIHDKETALKSNNYFEKFFH